VRNPFSKKEEAGIDPTLICPRCHTRLESTSSHLLCGSCGRSFPVDDGIADFAEGTYYDNFPGPEVLTADALQGLSNEHESARLEDYYLSKIRGLSVGRKPAGKLRVLDSGCGNGESVDALLAAGFDAWGHDLSALRKWQWKTRARRDRLVVADGSALPFPDGFFAAVIASGVLEHVGVTESGGENYAVVPLPDRDARRASFLSGLLRVLSKQGSLFLDFPNGAFPIDFWHGTKAGGARWHPTREGFLPTVHEIESLCSRIDDSIAVTPLSPHRRLRFNQVAGHWYGRLFRFPMKAFYRLMSVPGFRFLAATPLNPYLVLEIRKGHQRASS
jgi:SAM-dependent methyltransferase